jgi:hypothetical protein
MRHRRSPRRALLPSTALSQRQKMNLTPTANGHDDSPPRNMVLRLRRTRLTSRDGRLSVVANQVQGTTQFL